MPGDMNTINFLPENSTERLELAFSIHANTRIRQINSLISEYNMALERNEKLSRLYQINELRKTLEDEKPQDIIIEAFTVEIENRLFKECREQFTEFNISMHEQALAENHPTHPLSFPTPINPFANMLANMQPEDVRQLLYILNINNRGLVYLLSHGYPFSETDNHTHLSQLFEYSHPENHNLINRYQKTYLGGGNSSNFLFVSRYNPESERFVPRVEHRLGGAREMDTWLRKGPLTDRLIPIEAVRSVTCYGVTRTLLIAPLYSGGTPLTHSRKNKTVEDLIEGVLDIYIQMGSILINLNKENCLFPDAKNSNWLLNKDGKLIISDTKSLVFSDNGYHDYNKMYTKNQWILGATPILVQTRNYSPPEINTQRFDADQMHVYILGKNMYQYITRCDDSYLFKRNAESFDFNSNTFPVFGTPEGRMFKALIGKMSRQHASQRISVAAVVNQLNYIKSHTFAVKTLGAMKNTETHDPEMNKFIEKQLWRVAHATPEKMEKLISKIMRIAKENQNTKDFITPLLDILRDERRDSESIQNAVIKADSIEQALCSIPVKQRGMLLTAPHPSKEIIALRVALGDWRTAAVPAQVSASGMFSLPSGIRNTRPNAKNNDPSQAGCIKLF